MSNSVQGVEIPGGGNPHSEWPEDGGKWSEDEDGGGVEECDLQEMAEEDEEIDLYNEETFGLDLDMAVEDAEGDPTDLLLFCGDKSPTPPSPRPCTPSSPSLPKRGPHPQIQPQAWSGMQSRERGDKDRLGGRGKMFDDPAVMRTVEGRPSLKSLDSAIVDSGTSSSWQDKDSDAWVLSSYGTQRCVPGSILQDKAIVGVIDRPAPGRILPTTLDFLSPLQRPFPAFRGAGPGKRQGQLPTRPFGQRYLSQMQMNPMMPRSPVHPQQQYGQSGSLRSPSSFPRPPVSQAFTPKMMQLRFGAHSPTPAPFYSPSANPVQRFRFPGHVTQLHPQHRRLLSQRQQRGHRKTESWDPHSQLMSLKEKEWIIRLQMIQLQSENPHLDDYYYQEYYHRMEAKLAEEELLGDRAKREPPKLTTPYVTKTDSYTPVVHIEGSLGQVAVSTCFSPRRAIDAVHAHCPEEEQKDTRQQRLAVLHNLEKLFMTLLEVEEGERRRAAVFSEGERGRLREKMQRRVELIYRQMQHPVALESGEEFLPCLLVSKGKRLLARLIPFLSQEAALHILSIVTSHLSVLMSRDTDEALPVLYPSLCTVIGRLSFSQLIGVLRNFTSKSPETKESQLSLACQNKGRDCCPLKFPWSQALVILRHGPRLCFRWPGSSLSAPWWSPCSYPQICCPSSAATWTSAPSTSWRTAWRGQQLVVLLSLPNGGDERKWRKEESRRNMYCSLSLMFLGL
ncbi:protein PAT1 homolog 2 isoform X2 [Conger conger]|uniref:protein PAT1 homolog 2 isoform X2 n=1 Tax=Conger conger TaxID=82655 RepID=UPI002A5AF275|nr:protein PAT1 homolog 2 isoform X2 [Conger conger]